MEKKLKGIPVWRLILEDCQGECIETKYDLSTDDLRMIERVYREHLEEIEMEIAENLIEECAT